MLTVYILHFPLLRGLLQANRRYCSSLDTQTKTHISRGICIRRGATSTRRHITYPCTYDARTTNYAKMRSARGCVLGSPRGGCGFINKIIQQFNTRVRVNERNALILHVMRCYHIFHRHTHGWDLYPKETRRRCIAMCHTLNV